MKKILNKIKEFFAKIWAWIQKQLKKTKLDNKLFAMGVNEVREEVLKAFDGVVTVDLKNIKNSITMEINKKFKWIKPVTKEVIEATLNFAFDKAINIKVFTKANITKYINSVFDAIISLYDEKL